MKWSENYQQQKNKILIMHFISLGSLELAYQLKVKLLADRLLSRDIFDNL
jgi:hypothetical protein